MYERKFSSLQKAGLQSLKLKARTKDLSVRSKWCLPFGFGSVVVEGKGLGPKTSVGFPAFVYTRVLLL